MFEKEINIKHIFIENTETHQNNKRVLNINSMDYDSMRSSMQMHSK